ncbi:MAG: ABC transporter permease subunit [Syntrophobacterales bacterium]|nr:ABC transporter permease subunit [Syntrophobacterales bacterium]
MTTEGGAGRTPYLFRLAQPLLRPLSAADLVVVALLGVLLWAGVRLGAAVPEILQASEISLAPGVLPYYAALSCGRMLAAYLLSLTFSLIYGTLAAKHQLAEKILLPLLDVLQSVPILSFLPVALLTFSAFLPLAVAVELAAIFLIFTSQAWNLTFAWYQSLRTIPRDLEEASTVFRFPAWLRFKHLELPFAAISLIWNSMMSWAGGWFFLMAAEMFSAGQRDFRLPGLGSYLQEAANQGSVASLVWGLGTMVGIIVLLDQLVWRPLLAWAEKFKLQMVESEHPPTSWFYDVLRGSFLLGVVWQRLFQPVLARLDLLLLRWFGAPAVQPAPGVPRPWLRRAAAGLGMVLLGLGLWETSRFLWQVSGSQWLAILMGLGATLLRVAAALVIALAWTIPLGVLIGTQPRLAALLQPLVQVVASIPATALFPVVLLLFLKFPGGLNLAAVLLMLLGTQWYLLFNVIAGASAIPRDLQYTSALLGQGRLDRWRTLILPAIFPYVITGGITASGGAWNASIVAEYVQFGGRSLATTGLGAIISQATAAGDYPLLLAATLCMILAVASINRLFWRRLYRLAEERYRLD